MRRLGALLLGVGLAVTACGGAGRSGLAEAMAQVSGDGPAATYFEYGDTAHWREIGAVTLRGPRRDEVWGPVTSGVWASALGSGLGDLALSAATSLPERTGIDLYGADHVVTIGLPPNRAVRADGEFDAEAIDGKLSWIGAKPRDIGGHDGLTLAPDLAVEMDGVQTKFGLLNQLNQVVVTGTTVAAGPGAQAVAAALGGGRSLADRPAHAAVAECLGGVVSALLYTPRAAGEVELYGVGLRRPEKLSDRPVNVICVLARTASARKVGDTFAARLTTAAATAGGRPFGRMAERIEHDTVESGGRRVSRATLTLSGDTPASFAWQLALRNELDALTRP
ncbi:hypothetical protein [Microtetraspora niveoalba]|uniref:hypothetical protein n=1 Tax=Microtetraspora niveoalba TaxID=46175 RepID=UPI00082BD3BF|nr:hypothetical protein [Microtetraspora niveoalba]